MQEKLEVPAAVEPCATHQNIFRNLRGHVAIFELLQNGMFHLKRAYRQFDAPAERKEKMKRIFETAYECLTLFCKNNEANQKVLSEKLKLFLQNLDYELGQINLICEICRDNRYVCENYCEMILTGIFEKIENNGRQAAYLEPLTVSLQNFKWVFL